MTTASRDSNYIVSGRITNQQDEPIAGLVVRAYDQDPKTPDNPLGEPAVTDADGRYRIDFTEQDFKIGGMESGGPDVFIRVFAGEELLGESPVTRNAGRSITIDLQVDYAVDPNEPPRRAFGVVRDAEDQALLGVMVRAYDRDLRSEQPLGKSSTDKQGAYEVRYFARQFRKREKDAADLVVKAFAESGDLLVASDVWFNAPMEAEVNLTVPADVVEPSSLFERVGRAVRPLLGNVKVEDLDEHERHQDVSFLSGETGFEKSVIARFAIAHKLAAEAIAPEFWFVVVGGSFYEFTEGQSLADQFTNVLEALPSLDESAVRKALTRGFNQREISESFRKRVDRWVEEFLQFVARRTVKDSPEPSFAKAALEHAGIKDAQKQEQFARLFNQHKSLTPELLETLEKDQSFNKEEIADLRASYELAELTRGDFSVVSMLKDEYGIRQPEKIRTLAKRSEAEWVDLIKEKQAAGQIKLPLEMDDLAGQEPPTAELYGKTLERQFREAFPTTAFAGGLERAMKGRKVKGIRHANALRRFLEVHEDFEFLNTPIDDFLKNGIHRDFRELAKNEEFRVEMKATQRLLKLAPTFEAADALLADRVHSAQQIYRMGESEFVRRYADRPGFTKRDAQLAWNRAADTHAAVLTIVADLKAHEDDALPMALKTGSQALSTFPNWQNLFQTGDLCECEHCRSVLSPAAYFTDLLMFLRDRRAKNPAHSVKDILFKRRPDLGYIELNCDNALVPLPYIDVVCEVLEDVVAAGENDLELAGFVNMPANQGAAKAAVAAALGAHDIGLGDEFSLSQVDPADPDRWVAHGDDVTYLLKKKATPNFFAEVLRNTKAKASELRAYPQYVNPRAYDKLRQAKYPLALPFDLFAEEVRAAFQKTNLQRWDLMRTFRGNMPPNDPTDGEIAAEYFGISADPAAAFDEKRLILAADASVAGQRTLWGETGNAGWLATIGNVKNFLQKTGLEYNELLALLDLKFINSAGDIVIQHLDASCDTDKKVIQVLDAAKLDRIHRFLRLWRKLKDWKMWELDLTIRHPHIGNGSLDESFLVQLFYLSRLKKKLGKKATVEQVCALLGDLNTETRFTKLHEKREDALYQELFLNKRLIQPLDPAFELHPATGDLPAGETITAHHPAVVAALRVRESDLVLLKGLVKASDGTLYINDDLTLASLSFLGRHAWLSKLLKYKADEWAVVLKLLQQDLLQFDSPQAAWQFVETIDHLEATGFKPDELNWILAADRSAKAATKESDASRFLLTLRKDLQAIQSEHDPAQFDFLTAAPPTDIESLESLLTSLLQKLNRDEAAPQFFIATLRDEVGLETTAAGLPPGFDFPAAIKSSIRVRYHEPTTTLRFTGLMTAAEQATLLTDASLAAVTGIAAYQDAIEELFTRLRLALKFFEAVFTAPLENLPAAVDFGALPDVIAAKVSYDPEEHLLRFAGIMTSEEQAALDALSADPDYRNAVNSLATQPGLVAPPDDRIWLLDADLQFPLRDLAAPANDHLAVNLVTAATKALGYLSKTLSEGAVIQQASAQLGISEALARRLMTEYALLPDTLLAHFTGPLVATAGVVDYATLKQTFDGWFWAVRVAAILKQWKITVSELEKLSALTAAAQLLDFLALPLDDAGALPAIERVLRTHRLLHMRDTLPETKITLLEVLEKLNGGEYAGANEFAADVELLNDVWPAADVQALTASLDLAYPADFLLAETWERMRRAFYFIENLNANADTVKIFAAPAMSHAHAGTVKELLRSKFGAETWLTLSGEIQDVLRERKRDALAAYLLTQPKPADAPSGKWENTNDLYAYYLLDVEMSSCQLTSRLVQGSGSVQLFVQRCFMGLEPDVEIKADGDDGDSAWRWWKWMRKYRVWEANRKVFLWPENWIEPELKKDRSPFFKDLENELLQNEINQYSVETAFLNYLEKLEGVAQLEIAGFYQEDDGDDAIIHVFGRTKGGEPHLYHYRRYDYRQWSPWEKVDLDIQGDYLIPAVINKRLFLFWPVFTEVPDEAGNETVTVPAASPNEQPNQPVQKTAKKLKLQMAVSDYRQGKWTPKRISTDFHQSATYTSEIVRKHYRFFPIDRSGVDGRFGIKYDGASLDSGGGLQAAMSGAFEIIGCKGVPERTSLPGVFLPAVRPEPESAGNLTGFMKWAELGQVNEFGRIEHRQDLPENDFTLINNFAQLRLTRVLSQTPWFYHMSPAWHLSYMDRLLLDGALALGALNERGIVSLGSWVPYFYNDKKRTFFVLPSLGPMRRQNTATHLTTSVVSNMDVRLYYPDVKRVIRQWEDQLEGLLVTWLDQFNLNALSPAQRQQIEQFLHQQFPAEPLPPYTDEQVKDLVMRFFMRFVHFYLAFISLSAFQFRQFHFKNFYHPFVCEFAKLVYNPLKGIPALMSRPTQLMNTGFRFRQSYQPTFWVVDPSTEDFYPVEDVDFSPDGAYAPYNWELFFHAPLLIANALSKNQRFEEARDWYHFIFNPIGVESPIAGGSPMSKYWITKPFFETTDTQYLQQRIDNILRMLAGDTNVPGFSAKAKKDLEDQVRDWRTNPFEPHRIANYRTVAYQKTVVMKYLDNLIAWGDYLFRQDSMESINEAAQLYVLAAEILGPRPKSIPPHARPPVESFNELEDDLDKFANALVEVENLVPSAPGAGGAEPAPLPTLYFCVPRNDKLLGYWDTVADRLYKLRHCMNIEGVVRQLALFEPPIDPGALVKAVAGGMDIGSALADLNAPLPLYRFNVLLQKANEVCNDVKALGGALLAALEKKDAEALSLLRQSQEIRVLEAVKAVREKQIEEAKEILDGMKKSKELAEIRKEYYESREFMNAGEIVATVLNTASTLLDIPVSIGYIIGGVLKAIPNFVLGAEGFGGSPRATAETGGGAFGDAAKFAAEGLAHIARNLDKMASLSSTIGSYSRRQDEWDFQKDLAAKEIEQLDEQISAAELRISIAEKELENHELQVENAKATDEFMRSKYTNMELYQWQVGQISGVFFQSYKLAYDLAKRAERCFRFELGLQDSSYINFGYWDSLKKGLLSGERLQYDLRRLETAYLQQNRREFELIKNVSLALLDPLALVRLRETGRCFFSLPEETFDLDYPGHYFRRIKSVSLTLPCVTGPHTTISCTLRLLKNSIRINTADGDNGYPRNTDDDGLPADDTRFIENNIPVKAIAASSAQNDSGVFELSFRDERYLPFEGAGAISQWSLELFNDLPTNNPDPANPDFGRPLRQFDYSTISDAVLHLKYTAREDAGPFKNAAIARLREYLSEDDPTRSVRVFNLRQEFPTQWHRFLNPTNPPDGNILELDILPDLFRILDRGKTLKVSSIGLLARCTNAGNYSVVLSPPLPAPPPANSDTITLARVNEFGGLHFGVKDTAAADIEILPIGPHVQWRLGMTRPGGGNLQKDPLTNASEVQDLLLFLSYQWET
ncbi:MAG TPA: neuraminidase-like domain-containing protein [Pirellulaceae bacterium]|nr:neuraminidase-like domain-containing protein [Pirellulaceae bacterium]